MTLTAAEPDEAYAGLIEDRFDLAVTFDYDIDAREPPEVVARRRLMDDPVLAAMPNHHPLAKRRSISLGRLAKEPWIAAPLAGLPLSALQRTAGTGVSPTLRYQGEDFATVLELVAAGLGIALLPRFATTKLPKRIATIPLFDTPINRRIYTARLHGRHPATATIFDELLRT